MKLSELSVGRCGVVTAVRTQKNLAARLQMLNVSAGARVRLLRLAPFGGGFMLEAGGVRLAVRRSVAEAIDVEPCGEGDDARA